MRRRLHGLLQPGPGVRALGYLEGDSLPPGARWRFVTHSGSAFSALLRNTPDRLQPGGVGRAGARDDDGTTRRLGRRPRRGSWHCCSRRHAGPERLRAALARAAEADVPVVVLTVGRSGGPEDGRAHSGALAGEDAAYDALVDALRRDPGARPRRDGRHRRAARRRTSGGRRRPRHGPRLGRGAHPGRRRRHEERLAFAPLAPTTRRPAGRPRAGLEATNPLDVWGTGTNTRALFAGSLTALAADPAVGAVALGVDLVREHDGDDSYPLAALDAAAATPKPPSCSPTWPAPSASSPPRGCAKQASLSSSTRSGLRALGHLMNRGERAGRRPAPAFVDEVRSRHWRDRLAAGPLDAIAGFAMLRDYGITVVRVDTAAKSRCGRRALRFIARVARGSRQDRRHRVAHKSTSAAWCWGFGTRRRSVRHTTTWPDGSDHVWSCRAPHHGGWSWLLAS